MVCTHTHTHSHRQTYSHSWWCCSAARWGAAAARHSSAQPESCHSRAEHSPPCGTGSRSHRPQCMAATHRDATPHRSGQRSSYAPTEAFVTQVIVLATHLWTDGTFALFRDVLEPVSQDKRFVFSAEPCSWDLIKKMLHTLKPGWKKWKKVLKTLFWSTRFTCMRYFDFRTTNFPAKRVCRYDVWYSWTLLFYCSCVRAQIWQQYYSLVSSVFSWWLNMYLSLRSQSVYEEPLTCWQRTDLFCMVEVRPKHLPEHWYWERKYDLHVTLRSL